MSVVVKKDGTAVVTEDTPELTGAATAEQEKVTTSATDTTKTPEAVKTNTETTPTAGYNFSVANPPTAYEGKYDQQLADLYNEITQRKPFTYNANEDDLYQQYVQRYQQLGEQSMMDTMGQAAALTGGYGNSYAQNVGQQAYDQYMLGLNDKATEMYQLAYDRYKDQGNQMLQQYGMLGDLAADDYSKWRDSYDQYMAEAALRAQAGDFSPYSAVWGEDTAGKMQDVWTAQNLMPLYAAGQIDAETYKSIAGVYPVGYVEPGSAAASDSGSWYVDAYRHLATIGANEADSKAYYDIWAPYAY